MSKRRKWITVSWDDIKGVRRSGAHQMAKKLLHWPYCARCGLIALKNSETRRALRQRCVWWEDK